MNGPVLEIDFYANRRRDLGGFAAAAAELERAGCAGLWSIEAGSDPLLPLTLAATPTRRMELGTAVAVALAPEPSPLCAPYDVADDVWERVPRAGLGPGTDERRAER